MGDKSPKSGTTKKVAGKSIKEKRLEKKSKAGSPTEIIPSTKKH